MRIDWIPYSASALVAGAGALSVGAVLTPSIGDDSGSVMLSEFVDNRWLAVAALYFIASVALTVGLPSIITLFEERGGRLGLTAIGVFAIGTLGVAGYAMLLAFVRALALKTDLTGAGLDEVAQETGLLVFLYGWIGAFYLGELLLGIALLRAATIARWVPGLLLLHVALLPVSSLLPDTVAAGTALLITVALAAVGIQANQMHAQTYSSV
jgi:hypothetical protein